MLWMKVRDLLKIPCNSEIRNVKYARDTVTALKKSIEERGWLEDSGIAIADNKITAGHCRFNALVELVAEGKLDTDAMIRVEVYRTMWVQQLVQIG